MWEMSGTHPKGWSTIGNSTQSVTQTHANKTSSPKNSCKLAFVFCSYFWARRNCGKPAWVRLKLQAHTLLYPRANEIGVMRYTACQIQKVIHTRGTGSVQLKLVSCFIAQMKGVLKVGSKRRFKKRNWTWCRADGFEGSITVTATVSVRQRCESRMHQVFLFRKRQMDHCMTYLNVLFF